MEKFTTVTGVGVPLKRSNVDTDQIIPAVYLKRITKTGFDDALFAAWRNDPAFVLNNPIYAQGSILVAGPDFGTGSSREHAVWALRDYGFKVVISPRFADIFTGNAGKQGLVTAKVEEATVERLWELMDATPGLELTVSLDDLQIVAAGEAFPFTLDEYTRWRLREGLDDIALTLRDEQSITEFESRRAGWLPKTLPIAASVAE